MDSAAGLEASTDERRAFAAAASCTASGLRGISAWYTGGTVGELVSHACNKTAIAPTVRSAGPFGGRLAAMQREEACPN